jgi:hypothetical protein
MLLDTIIEISLLTFAFLIFAGSLFVIIYVVMCDIRWGMAFRESWDRERCSENYRNNKKDKETELCGGLTEK